MSSEIESWIRVGDERYDDCLVGNRKGLEALKSAIDDVLARGDGSTELASFTDSDVTLLVLADEKVKKEPQKSWRIRLFESFIVLFLFIWLLFLPIWGAFSLIRHLLK